MLPPWLVFYQLDVGNTALAGGAPYTAAGSQNYNLINAIRHGHWTLSLVLVMIQWRYGDRGTSGQRWSPHRAHHTPYTASMSPLIAFNV